MTREGSPPLLVPQPHTQNVVVPAVDEDLVAKHTFDAEANLLVDLDVADVGHERREIESSSGPVRRGRSRATASRPLEPGRVRAWHARRSSCAARRGPGPGGGRGRPRSLPVARPRRRFRSRCAGSGRAPRPSASDPTSWKAGRSAPPHRRPSPRGARDRPARRSVGSSRSVPSPAGPGNARAARPRRLVPFRHRDAMPWRWPAACWRSGRSRPGRSRTRRLPCGSCVPQPRPSCREEGVSSRWPSPQSVRAGRHGVQLKPRVAPAIRRDPARADGVKRCFAPLASLIPVREPLGRS